MEKYLNKFYDFIDRIGKHNFILITFIIIVLIITGLYQTFSLYTESEDVTLVDGFDTYSFILNPDNANNSVTIVAGNKKNLDITVYNKSDTNLLYGIYYTSSNVLDDVAIWSTENTTYFPSVSIGTNSSYVVTVKVNNFSDSNVTIDFGVKYGFENGGGLTLEEGENWIMPLNSINTLFTSSTDYSYFKEDAYREKIVNASFVKGVDTSNVAVDESSNPIMWDISIDDNNRIIAWLEENETNSDNYNLYIGSNDIIFAKDLSYFFADMINLQNIFFDNLNTSMTTSMRTMFASSKSDAGTNMSLTSLDLSSFNTSKVTSMEQMFAGCSSLTSLDLSSFDTSKVTSMYKMFKLCSNLSTTITIRNPNVTNYTEMFLDAATAVRTKIFVDYTAETSDLVDSMILTKSADSDVIKMNTSFSDFYTNVPNLDDGNLIPVVYNGSDWIVVNDNSKWYDYINQEWANAVILKSNVLKSVGDVVDLENDIRGIFVWIPRYEYKISVDGSNELYINFVSSGKTVASNGYILPDAFTFGTTNVDGIWFGKFETSMDNSTDELYVIPNAVAVTSQTVSTQFNLGLSFKENLTSVNIDSHMVKNSEWGAVAYLSQSLYGKFGNGDYSNENKEIYVNDSLGLYTGRSSGSITSEGSTYGTYNYDDGFVDGTEKSGIGASTTGNITGIYDMSGGAYEYVMGYLTTASSTFGATDTGYNAAGFTSTPNEKYFDGYASSASLTTPYYSHALGETLGWYEDNNVALSGSLPWYMRGGVADGGTNSGIFSYETISGYMGSYASFRVALIINN